MAIATRSSQGSPPPVVDILNQSGTSSAQSRNKRKKTLAVSRRPVGRPRKKTKVPKMAPSAPTGEEATNYSLNNEAFDPVPASKEEAADFGSPTSQRTRSKATKARPLLKQAQPGRPDGPVCQMRKLPVRRVISDRTRNDSLAVVIGTGKPSPTSRSRSQQRQTPDRPEIEAATVDSGEFGYPSAQKVSARHKVRGAAHDPAPAPATGRRIVTNETQPPHSDTAEDQSGDVEEEEEEEGEEGAEEEDVATAPEKELAAEGNLGAEKDLRTGGKLGAEERGREEEEENVGQDRRAKSADVALPWEDEIESHDADQQAVENHDREDRPNITSTNDQHSQSPKRKGRFPEAMELHGCGEHWTKLWDAAKDNRCRGNPETRPVLGLVEAINRFKARIRSTSDAVPEQEERSLPELEDSELDEIATEIGNLRKSASRTGEQEKQLIKDIYLQVIPRTVDLLRSILIVRFDKGKLSISALEELLAIAKAARGLCERVYHWKPTLQMGEGVKSRTNLEIKQSLKRIEDEYRAALTRLRIVQYEAAKVIREKEAAKQQMERRNAEQQMVIEKRQRIADQVQEYKTQMTQSRQRGGWTRAPTRIHHEGSDVDDLDLGESDVPSVSGIASEGTEDIPGPTKRVWREEETIALLLLLQKHLGPDRYERIQESICEISRLIRKRGAENFLKLLTMADQEWPNVDTGAAGDVLDDLGDMEVEDVERQAKFIKASCAQDMESDIKATGDRSKWRWLLSV